MLNLHPVYFEPWSVFWPTANCSNKMKKNPYSIWLFYQKLSCRSAAFRRPQCNCRNIQLSGLSHSTNSSSQCWSMRQLRNNATSGINWHWEHLPLSPPCSSSTPYHCHICKYLRDVWAKHTIYNSILLIYAYRVVQFFSHVTHVF